MTSAKALLGNLVGRFVFTSCAVTAVEKTGAHFLRVRLSAPALRATRWSPGDKVQVFIPEAGMRTYTPTHWDTQGGHTEFVIYLHADSPGVRWARSLRDGSIVQFFGPRSSLPLEGSTSPLIFGDETSVALVKSATPFNPRAVLEVADVAETKAVLTALGINSAVTLIERRADESHRDSLIAAMSEAIAGAPAQKTFFSGRAFAIQALKQALKQRGVELPPGKTKAYWALGKTGLD